MIICAYYGIETMLKNNIFKNQYMVMNPMDYKHREDDPVIPWEQEYVGFALLMSDLGFKVVILPNEEVLAEIERRNLDNIIYIYPDSRQKDDWVEYLNGRLLADETNNNIDGLVRAIYNYEYDINEMKKYAKKGHSLEIVNKDITPAVVLLEGDIFGTRKESAFYKFIWGLTNEDKDPDLYTDNYVEVVQDKQTGEYYATLDRVEDVEEAFNSLCKWGLPKNLIDVELKEEDADYHFTEADGGVAIWGNSIDSIFHGMICCHVRNKARKG